MQWKDEIQVGKGLDTLIKILINSNLFNKWQYLCQIRFSAVSSLSLVFYKLISEFSQNRIHISMILFYIELGLQSLAFPFSKNPSYCFFISSRTNWDFWIVEIPSIVRIKRFLCSFILQDLEWIWAYFMILPKISEE